MQGHGLEELVHQDRVDHGSLINNQQVALQRVIFILLKSSLLWAEFQQPVDDLGLSSGRLGHSLRGASSGRGEQDIYADTTENLQHSAISREAMPVSHVWNRVR